MLYQIIINNGQIAANSPTYKYSIHNCPLKPQGSHALPRTMPPGRSKGKEQADPTDHDADVAASIARQQEKGNPKRKKNQTSSDVGSDDEGEPRGSSSGSGSRTKKPKTKGKAKGKTKGKTKDRKKRKKKDPHYYSTMTPAEAREAAKYGAIDQLALLETANTRVGPDGVPYRDKCIAVRDSGSKASLMPTFKRSTIQNVLTGFLQEELISCYERDVDYPLSRSDYEKAYEEGRTITVYVESKDISDAYEKFESRRETVAKKTDGSVNPEDFECVSESDDSEWDPENWHDQNSGEEFDDPGTPSSEAVTDVEEEYPGSSIVYSPRSPSPASDAAGSDAAGSDAAGSGDN